VRPGRHEPPLWIRCVCTGRVASAKPAAPREKYVRSDIPFLAFRGRAPAHAAASWNKNCIAVFLLMYSTGPDAAGDEVCEVSMKGSSDRPPRASDRAESPPTSRVQHFSNPEE